LSNGESQQRPSHQVSESYSQKLGLFADDVTYGKLAAYTSKGATIKTTKLSDSFSYDDYQLEYKARCLPLCAIDNDGKLRLFTTSNDIKPKSGWQIISLITAAKTLS